MTPARRLGSRARDAALALAGWALMAGCLATSEPVASLAVSRVAVDFPDYELRRVGIVPFTGREMDEREAAELQAAFLAELGQVAEFEIVSLSPDDIREVPESDPFRRGWYRPRTVIDVARRYHLDGLFVGAVTDSHSFPPLRFGVQLDLVSSDTGMVLWTTSLNVDTGREDVRRSVSAWSEHHLGDDEEGARMALLSPRRLARFAAWQVAGEL